MGLSNTNFYFEEESSVYSGSSEVCETLNALANRYIANNPQKELTARAQPKDSFIQEFTGRYIFDFNDKFPDSQNGDYAYAFSYAFLNEEGPAVLGFRSNTPAWVYMNGELIFETTSFDEGQFKEKTAGFTLKKGANIFLVKCKKNALGFGCEFGSAGLQNGALVYLNPLREMREKRGWAYCKADKEDIFKNAEEFPKIGDEAGILWLPKVSNKHLSVDEVLGSEKGFSYLMTGLLNDGIKKEFTFTGKAFAECFVYVDGEEAFSGKGEISFKKVLSGGLHKICVQLENGENEKSGFSLKTDNAFSADNIVRASGAEWLYLGKLKEADKEILKNPDMHRVYEGEKGKCYWQTDLGEDVRLSSESGFFGRWTYPLGVVLYGLCEAAKELSDKHIADYAKAHIKRISDSYEYALYDTQKFGRAALDYQLIMVDSLDYCGSCGNALLNILDYSDKGAKMVSDMIADFMKNKQERLENGMFYRKATGSYQENSVWADDLYMSVPFLCRYYKKTGDSSYLDDAARQFKCFYDYLYMPDKKIMSHVYSLNYGKKNEIPWGRGNGWVVFALSELLGVLPENHADREFLLKFYRDMCEGILSYQDECGMWHQVIDEPEAFLESSCTAMFICAFCRGIINGWLLDEKFAKAANRAWKALCSICIDYGGNLYGVCRGSMLSFRREYYLNELGWNLNDQHGTGIVMLAGCDILRMQNLT